jgi:hypothetical protein
VKLGSVVIATCVLSASPLKLMGAPAVGNYASPNVGRVPHPLALALPAPHAASTGIQRSPFGIGQAPHSSREEISLELASAGATGVSDSSVAFPVRWQKPELERVVRSFRRAGLPIVHLWGSGRNVLAIGLSPHGVPGIYFTQKVPD